jgi:hypothetical protein
MPACSGWFVASPIVANEAPETGTSRSAPLLCEANAAAGRGNSRQNHRFSPWLAMADLHACQHIFFANMSARAVSSIEFNHTKLPCGGKKW